MNNLWDNIALGLGQSLNLTNLSYCLLGVIMGQIVGTLPGIGVLVAISLLLPFTYHLDLFPSLLMMAGLYYGTSYGGSVSSILLNVPGQASSAVACLDGYPMTQQGRSGVALFMTTAASFFGASIGIILMMLLSPLIAQNALNFGPWEYFAVMTLGLIAASTIGTGSPIKGIAMVVLGLFFGTVGLDIHSGSERFTFGYLPLYDGIGLASLVMGLFAVPEIIYSIRTIKQGSIVNSKVSFWSMIPTRDDVRRSWMPMIRGTAIGSFFGALPGTGGMVASFMAYAMEKRVARDPSRFGRGAIEGVVAPEAANNAADQAAFIPTMILGIPGSVTMAILIGVMISNGVTPGPTIISEQPELFWGLIVSFWIGNVILVVLNIPLIGLWVKLLLIPYRLLYPMIMVFVCVGAFIVQGNSFDVAQVAFFAAIGCAMRWAGLSGAPFILGFVLGPMMEVHLRRSLVLSRGDFLPFIERPISATLLLATVALLVWLGISTLRARSRRLPEQDLAD